MCNLYDLMSDDEVGDYFRAQNDWRNQVAVEKSYAAPGKPGYVVRLDDGQRVRSTMLWGYPTTKPRKTPPKPGQDPFTVDWWTNARDLTKSLWKGSVADPAHRCLVPFRRFAEPKAAADRAEPRDLNWWFTVVDRPGAAFAGIWKEDPRFGRVYSFCTTEPNSLVGAVHPKAMPVILDESDYDRWLTAPWEDAQALVTAFPAQLMQRG